jgi:multiple sugar transport system substrate-binding protein
MLAMNEKSKVKDEAWQFLQFLLSDEMQSAPGFNGFPVRQSSLRKTVGGIMEKLQNGKVQIRVQSQDGQTTQQPTVGDKDKETVLQIAGMADTYIYEDTQVMRIAREEADAFFKGEKSAEDTARSIQNRVTTYLNE